MSSSTIRNTDPGDRSAAELEREVEATRARLTGTVEQLREKVSPGQVAEQAMDWLKGSGGKEFVGNLGSAVRDNPVPVLLIAAGIGWLALSGRGGNSGPSRAWSNDYRNAPPLQGGSDYPGGSHAGAAYMGEEYGNERYLGESYTGESYPAQAYAGGRPAASGPSLGERAGDAVQGLRDAAGNLVGRAGDMASGAGQTAGDAWEGARGTAASLAGQATEAGRSVAQRAGEAWESATDAVSGTAARLSDRASRLGDRAYGAGNDLGRTLSSTVESQPLLLGAVGIALGAAIGALFPSTEAEDRLMGETRDRLANQAAALAGEAWQQARDTAGEQLNKAGETLGDAYGRTKERVAGSGVDAQGGVQALGEVARDLREAVEKTVHEAAGTVRQATEQKLGEPKPGEQKPGGATDRPHGPV